MKTAKKLLAVLLVAVLAVGVFTVAASAETVTENAIAFVEALDDVDFGEENYGELKARVTTAEELLSAGIDEEHRGVATAKITLANVKEFLAQIDAKAQVFAEAVAAYDALPATATYDECYEAYLDIRAALVTDTTVNDQIETLLGRFEEIKTLLGAASDKAYRFAELVMNAAKATNFALVAPCILEADEIYAEIGGFGFPQVEEVLVQYLVLSAEINGTIEARDAYIQAVAVLSDTMTYQQMREAMFDATVAKNAFDAYGVIGLPEVTETDILYSHFASIIEKKDMICRNFIDAVDTATNAVSFADRFAAIRAAEAMEAEAEDAYPSVPAAKTALAAAKTAYDSDVNAVNGLLAEVTDAAGKVAAGTTSSDVIDKVVAFFGKLFA